MSSMNILSKALAEAITLHHPGVLHLFTLNLHNMLLKQIGMPEDDLELMFLSFLLKMLVLYEC